MRPRLRARPDEHQAARPLLADPKDINLSALNAIIQAACGRERHEGKCRTSTRSANGSRAETPHIEWQTHPRLRRIAGGC